MTAAELLRDFVNTADVEDATDDLGAPADLIAWLRAHDLLEDVQALADEEDLALARALREGLRGAMRHGRAPAPPLDLDRPLAALPLHVTVDPAPRLVPAEQGVRGGLAALAAAVIDARAEGTWPRLKVCGEDTCQVAFIDSSKNRSRAWCSMKVCGNRTKTRAYRARQRSTT